MMLPPMLTIAALQAAYAGGITPLDVVEEVIRRRDALADRAVFITETPAEALRDAARAVMAGPRGLPLWGIPFAVKDNIDVVGLPTTAACPAFAYAPEADATLIARLRAAGAIVIGKTNLDQFATGLNGTRCSMRTMSRADHPLAQAWPSPRGFVPLLLAPIRRDLAGFRRCSTIWSGSNRHRALCRIPASCLPAGPSTWSRFSQELWPKVSPCAG
jgi:hypothetical protein